PPPRAAKALGGGGAPAGGPAARGMVHGRWLRHHRGALRCNLRQFPQPAGGVAPAFYAAAARVRPPRALRPAHAGLRRNPAQSVGHARAAHRRHLPRHRRRGARAPRARLPAHPPPAAPPPPPPPPPRPPPPPHPP